MNREVRLKARPQGAPTLDLFDVVESPMPELGDGDVLVRNIFMSVDPYMRGRMNDVKSYVPPFQIGEALDGRAVGEVVESRQAELRVGDYVSSGLGWREYFTSDGSADRGELVKLDPSVDPLSLYLGVLGMPGMTAWLGMGQIGKPQRGETVFVSGAAGAVGSVAGQLASLEGCRVVGSAGSDAKVAFVTDELGFDAAFNYKSVDLEQAVAAACPNGIDVYFDNVGGAHLQAALEQMNDFGRIVSCGMISQYNEASPTPGPNNLAHIVRKRLRVQGFIVSDSADQVGEFRAEMTRRVAAGEIHYRETVVEGLENAPQAFIGLFQGDNIGKMVVQIGAVS
jgi:NADPH-dependent curcumin reductase CurA